MLRRLLVSIFRLLPAPPLTDDERIEQVRAECDTLNEQVWRSMRAGDVS